MKELQWGRDVIVADGGCSGSSAASIAMKLQWGRDVIVADGCFSWAWCSRNPGFNGAATLSSRMAERDPSCDVNLEKLQWGRDVIVADGRTRSTVSYAAPWLQWGRDVIVADGSICMTIPLSPFLLQWGRDVIVADGT